MITRRRRLVAAGTLTVLLGAGWLSSALTSKRCLAQSHSTVQAALDGMRAPLRQYEVFADLAERPISWARENELRDSADQLFGSKAWWYGPHLLPHSDRI